MFDALLYLLRTGCPWRMLPKESPHGDVTGEMRENSLEEDRSCPPWAGNWRGVTWRVRRISWRAASPARGGASFSSGKFFTRGSLLSLTAQFNAG